MSARLATYLRCERGVVALIFAIVLVVLLVIAGIAIDYTQVNSDKAAFQEHLDSAVLAGTTMKGIEDPKERLKIAEQHFYAVLPPHLAGLKKEISFELVDDENGIKGMLHTIVPTRIMKFFGREEAHIYLTSVTSINQPNSQLDMVFCIDASGSMQDTIDAVRNNARGLEENINEELSKRGYAQFGAIRVRVNFFRDYGPDQGDADAYMPGTWDEKNLVSNQPPMRRSKRGNFFELPDDRETFRGFLANETAFGGGDEPESGFICLNDAIHSDWGRPGESLARRGAGEKKINTIVPMVVIWTDANVLPLDDVWSEKNPSYPRNAPRDMNQLRSSWKDDHAIDQKHKVLIFFGNINNSSSMLKSAPQCRSGRALERDRELGQLQLGRHADGSQQGSRHKACRCA